MKNELDFPNVVTSVAAFDELEKWRSELREKIAARLQTMDPSAPDTLQYAIFALLEAHYKPKELSTILGPSQTTIGRWAFGQTIPRSPPYRKWLIEKILGYMRTGEAPTNTPGAVPAVVTDDKSISEDNQVIQLEVAATISEAEPTISDNVKLTEDDQATRGEYVITNKPKIPTCG